MNRRWLYGGLAVVAGVGLARLVRRGPKITPGATRLLLIGGAFAAGLAPPLRALAAEQKVPFECASRSDLAAKVATFRPTLVAVALDVPGVDRASRTAQAAALKGLQAAVQKSGAEIVWIGPPIPPTAALKKREPSTSYFPTGSALQLQRGPDGVQPTVTGYSGWAGALWQWLS